MPITFGLRSSMTCLSSLPLLVAPELGLPAADRAPTTALVDVRGFEHAALRRAAERDALDARRRHRRRSAAAHLSKNT